MDLLWRPNKFAVLGAIRTKFDIYRECLNILGRNFEILSKHVSRNFHHHLYSGVLLEPPECFRVAELKAQQYNE